MRGPEQARSFHAELTHRRDSIVMMGEPMGRSAVPPAQVHCYVDDVDAVYARAVTRRRHVRCASRRLHMAYGDQRISMVRDAYGNAWAISTHKEDVSEDEMMRRMASQKKG